MTENTITYDLTKAIRRLVEHEIDVLCDSDWFTEVMDDAVERAFERRRQQTPDVYNPPQPYKDENQCC